MGRDISEIQYLDDFFAAGLPGSDPTIYELRFASICSTLGIQIKDSKSITGTMADFNGIEFDTIAMEARLPQQKLTKARDLVATLIKRRKATPQELQSITGYLSFCAKVIPIGRSFLRRLYDATANLGTGSPSGQQPIAVTPYMRLDLCWWNNFLHNWNGISLIQRQRKVRHMWTDASSTKGQGAFFAEPGVDHKLVSWQHVFSKPLSRHHRNKAINFQEMDTVLLAMQRCYSYFEHHQLVIFTDNTTVFHGLCHRSVRGSAMDPLRKITLLAAVHDIDIQAQWIPTHENTLADPLSRRDFAKLANLFPLLAQEPNPPSSLETHPNPGTPTLASPVSQSVTYGGASAPIPDEYTTQPDAAI